MDSKTIAIVGDRDTDKFRGWLIRDLVLSGHTVLVCAPQNAILTSRIGALGAEYLPVYLDQNGTNPLHDLFDLRNLVSLLRRRSVDMVLSHSTKQNVVGPLAAKLAGVPSVFAMIEGLGYAFVEGNEPRRRLLRIAVSCMLRMSLRCCDGVFVLNEADQAYIQEAGLVGPGQKVTRVNGTGIDLDYFAYEPPPEGGPVFLLIARLLREKGILEYMAAARCIKQLAPQSRFELLGPVDTNPGSLSAREIDALQSEKVVEYLGETDDVRPYLRACTTFVLPSYYREGLPRTVIEALAIGRPVITTDIPACRQTTIDGVNGFVVPKRDPVALATAMRRFIDEPSLALRMGKASREIAERVFDVDHVNAAIIRAMGLFH